MIKIEADIEPVPFKRVVGNRHKFNSGDDMFDWWVNERHGRYIAEDCNSIPLFSEDDGSIL